MNNFTKETYQTKREILTFSKKIAEGTRKTIFKFIQDMVYGILGRRN